MDYVETEGDTIDKAIENALKLLGVERDKITVDILSEGKKGILGFGSQKARIRATLRKFAIDLEASEHATVRAGGAARWWRKKLAAIGEKAKEALAEILKLMGISAEVELRVGEKSDETVVEIRAENSGLLIGRKGQTLEALQYLVSRIAGERGGTEGPHIVVDIENYRQRRRKSLEDMALASGGEGEAAEKDRDRRCLERRRSPHYSRGTARRSVGNNQESGARFVSPAVDHPRGRSKKEGSGPSSRARETGS